LHRTLEKIPGQLPRLPLPRCATSIHESDSFHLFVGDLLSRKSLVHDEPDKNWKFSLADIRERATGTLREGV